MLSQFFGVVLDRSEDTAKMRVQRLSIAERTFYQLENAMTQARSSTKARLVVHPLAEEPDLSPSHVKAPLAAQRTAIKAEEAIKYSDLNDEFQWAISRASGSPRVVRTADSIAGQVRVLVHSAARVGGRPYQSLNEHPSIVETIAHGDYMGAGTQALARALSSEGTLLDVLNASSPGTKY